VLRPVLALLVAAGAGSATWLLANAVAPPAVTRTVMPVVLSAFVGMCALGALGPRHSRWWRAFSAAWAIAAASTVAVLAWVPTAASANSIGRWAPGLSLLFAALWVGGWWWERRLDRRSPGLTAALVGLALTGAALSSAQEAADVVWRGRQIRAWNVYHYYIGSKYFADLGYHDLYAAALAADDAAIAAGLTPTLRDIKRTRDMHHYGVISRQAAVASLDGRVDDTTLAAIHADLRDLIPWTTSWDAVISDLGYNAAPAWAVVGGPIAEALPLRGTSLRVLTNLDVPLLALTAFALWWAWGPRMLAGAVFFVTVVGFNNDRLFGGFLQYDWFATLICGVALYRRGYARSAGVVLSYAAMTRVFPGFLIFPVLGWLAWSAVRKEKLEAASSRFAIAFTMACAVWFALSHTTGRGLRTWPEWIDAISVHSQLHGSIGRARLGLGRLGAHEPTADDWWGAVPRSSSLAVAQASDDAVRPWRALGVLLVCLALIRRSEQDRMALMLVLVWVVVVTSRYYGSSWALLLAAGLPAQGDVSHRQSAPGMVLGAGVLLTPVAFHAADGNEQIYFQVNYTFAAGAALALLAWLATDLRAQLTAPRGSATEAS
jgi:hypothetical protein